MKPIVHDLGLFVVFFSHKCIFRVMVLVLGNQEILGSNPTFVEIQFLFLQFIKIDKEF